MVTSEECKPWKRIKMLKPGHAMKDVRTDYFAPDYVQYVSTNKTSGIVTVRFMPDKFAWQNSQSSYDLETSMSTSTINNE